MSRTARRLQIARNMLAMPTIQAMPADDKRRLYWVEQCEQHEAQLRFERHEDTACADARFEGIGPVDE